MSAVDLSVSWPTGVQDDRGFVRSHAGWRLGVVSEYRPFESCCVVLSTSEGSVSVDWIERMLSTCQAWRYLLPYLPIRSGGNVHEALPEGDVGKGGGSLPTRVVWVKHGGGEQGTADH